MNVIFLALIAGILYGIYRIPPAKRWAKHFYAKHHKILIEIALAILVAVVIGFVIGKKL
jgi:uncharacterized protein YneF (UPF0154 family)